MQAHAEESIEKDSSVHYDIPAGVFELLLDKNMNYSSGCYVNGDESLDQSQIEKMDRIARYTNMKKGDRILDIGCGWGGPALYFAEQFYCDVTGINLSPVQREHALDWAEKRGVADRVSVEVRNVLDMQFPDESFDQITFLESIIHMPEKKEIFASCHRLLRPGGRIFIQESCYDRGSKRDVYLNERGFDEVNRAFGNTATMVSGGEMLIQLEEAGLVPIYLDNISKDYVITLSQWLDNLDREADRMKLISKQAYTMLRRYLMIALTTYRTGHTVCHQITAQKPAS